MTDPELLAAIGRMEKEFRFAKTMPWIPHWYVIRTKENERDWWRLFHAVQQDGVTELWHRRRFKYLYPGDNWRYWTMVATAEEKPILINRARLTDQTDRQPRLI
jgi:hypothetical protein